MWSCIATGFETYHGGQNACHFQGADQRINLIRCAFERREERLWLARTHVKQTGRWPICHMTMR